MMGISPVKCAKRQNEEKRWCTSGCRRRDYAEQASNQTQRIHRLLCCIAFLGKDYLSEDNALPSSPLVVVYFELDEVDKLIKLHWNTNNFGQVDTEDD